MIVPHSEVCDYSMALCTSPDRTEVHKQGKAHNCQLFIISLSLRKDYVFFSFSSNTKQQPIKPFLNLE